MSDTTSNSQVSPSSNLSALREHGVSVWLDDLSRELTDGGELQRLVDLGVLGVTSNPTIFATALSKGDRYTEQVSQLVAAGADTEKAVFEITTEDVRRACDVLKPVFDRTDGLDGRVSLEVDRARRATPPPPRSPPARCGRPSAARTSTSRSPRRSRAWAPSPPRCPRASASTSR